MEGVRLFLTKAGKWSQGNVQKLFVKEEKKASKHFHLNQCRYLLLVPSDELRFHKMAFIFNCKFPVFPVESGRVK